jgi:hypothetical protein
MVVRISCTPCSLYPRGNSYPVNRKIVMLQRRSVRFGEKETLLSPADNGTKFVGGPGRSVDRIVGEVFREKSFRFVYF